MTIVDRASRSHVIMHHLSISDLELESQDCSICDTNDDIDLDTGFICSDCAEKYCSD